MNCIFEGIVFVARNDVSLVALCLKSEIISMARRQQMNLGHWIKFLLRQAVCSRIAMFELKCDSWSISRAIADA